MELDEPRTRLHRARRAAEDLEVEYELARALGTLFRPRDLGAELDAFRDARANGFSLEEAREYARLVGRDAAPPIVEGGMLAQVGQHARAEAPYLRDRLASAQERVRELEAALAAADLAQYRAEMAQRARALRQSSMAQAREARIATWAASRRAPS